MLKNNNTVILIALVAFGVVFRILNNHLNFMNFNPTLAIALVAGMSIKNKKVALLSGLLVMIISDLYFGLFTNIPGYYGASQLINYLAVMSVSILGYFINNERVSSLLGGAVGGSLLFFVISNFGVWASGFFATKGGYALNFSGLKECYLMAIPFYSSVGTELFMNSLLGTLFFSTVLFYGVKVLKDSEKLLSKVQL
jgi:hypothetical protein